MLRKIIFPVLIALVVAIAAGTYLFSVNSVHFSTEETVTEVQSDGYVIKFTDSDGNPVSGVMAKVCDETSCTMVTSGEDGAAQFDGEPKAWEVQILSAPEGYSFPADEIYPLSEDGGETVIVLEKE